MFGSNACVVVAKMELENTFYGFTDVPRSLAIACDALFAFDIVGVEDALLDAHAHGTSSKRSGAV